MEEGWRRCSNWPSAPFGRWRRRRLQTKAPSLDRHSQFHCKALEGAVDSTRRQRIANPRLFPHQPTFQTPDFDRNGTECELRSRFKVDRREITNCGGHTLSSYEKLKKRKREEASDLWGKASHSVQFSSRKAWRAKATLPGPRPSARGNPKAKSPKGRGGEGQSTRHQAHDDKQTQCRALADKRQGGGKRKRKRRRRGRGGEGGGEGGGEEEEQRRGA